MKYSPSWASLSALLGELGLGSGPVNVLIVEDERAIRERLQVALTALGHRVDAREGVEREELPLSGFEVAFLDNYFLSKTLTGVSLTPELRRSCPSIVILAMSSDAGKNEEMMRMGANLAVAKSAIRRLT